MDKDKSIRISDKTYKILKQIKKKSGISIKRIIEDFCKGDIHVKS